MSRIVNTPSGVIWSPVSDKAKYLPKVVSAIHFHVYDAQYIDDPPQKKTNHWIMFLQIGPNESIRINARPAPMTNKLQLEVQRRPYSCSPVGLKTLSLKTIAQGITVNHILTTVLYYGLDEYTFNADGNGCRFWMLQLIGHLQQREYVKADQVNIVVQWLYRTWDTKAGKVIEIPAPVGTLPAPGTFG